MRKAALFRTQNGSFFRKAVAQLVGIIAEPSIGFFRSENGIEIT